MQGWKLFAEAHRIQAGDQVSFELVATKRMVVQVIRAAETPICKKAFPYPQKIRPPKALKNQGDSSPQGSQQYFCDSEEVDFYPWDMLQHLPDTFKTEILKMSKSTKSWKTPFRCLPFRRKPFEACFFIAP